jgi:Holliday junction resolvase
MAERQAKNQRYHDEMIRNLVQNLGEKGFTDIRASHIEEYVDHRPEKIALDGVPREYGPDIFAVRDGIRYIFEVETPDSIGGANAAEEFRVLATRAAEKDNYVYVVVPPECRAAAEWMIRKLDLTRRPETFILTVGA